MLLKHTIKIESYTAMGTHFCSVAKNLKLGPENCRKHKGTLIFGQKTEFKHIFWLRNIVFDTLFHLSHY